MKMELLYLLLPVAALTGWIIGKRSLVHASSKTNQSLSSDYYTGLNYLLNEQPDKAVDAFIRMLDASPDSVETTLALGNFFRRRGEVDRAIRIHQNLIAKPNLSSVQKNQALMALSQDYMCAGVLDRAETLLLDIVRNKDTNLESSLKHLIDIYEREKDWKKAIEFSFRLQRYSHRWMGKAMAHYYCELAQEAWDAGKIRSSFKYLKLSLKQDSGCVRASYLQGFFEKKLNHYKSAMKAFKKIEHQDKEFLTEVLPDIIESYQHLKEEKGLQFYLQSLLNRVPSMGIVIAHAEHIKHQEGKSSALKFLGHYMKKYPTLQGLKHMMEYLVLQFKGEVQSELTLLMQFVDRLLEHRSLYRCQHCGFSGKRLLWQCPSCRQWASVKPVQHLEEE